MRIEKELLKRKKADLNALELYGFRKSDDGYDFEKKLGKDDFLFQMHVDQNGSTSAKLMDPFSEEEYIAIHLERQQGAYVSEIRELYIRQLDDIIDHCFTDVPFLFDQTNRMNQWIFDTYGIHLEHTFQKDTGSAVYKADGKWFAVVLHPEESVIGRSGSQECELLNLKTDPKRMDSLLKTDGIFPAYHMNKKGWISIVMDDTVSDEFVQECIRSSYELNAPVHNDGYWIIPSNPKYYDIDHAFSVSDRLYWHQSSKMKVGDTVYIYYGAPYSQIRYKCRIVEANLHFPTEERTIMRLEKVYRYQGDLLNRDVLVKFGVKAVRSARYMPKELIEEIDQLYPEQRG